MNVHLYATDESVFRLLQQLPEKEQVSVTAIIVPQNREHTKKADMLVKRSGDIPVYVQTRTGWPKSKLPDSDIAVSWLYSQIIPPRILNTYHYGILNMHGGKIPQYRGANVLQWAIINGDTDLGVTWHTMVEKIDAGPIWKESLIPISIEDNALYLRELLIKEGIRTFPQSWSDCINPEKTGRIPNLAEGRYWPPRKPKDGRIYPRMTIKQVKDMIRALPEPWPKSTIKVGNLWMEIDSVSVLPIENSVPYETDNHQVIYLQLSRE